MPRGCDVFCPREIACQMSWIWQQDREWGFRYHEKKGKPPNCVCSLFHQEMQTQVMEENGKERKSIIGNFAMEKITKLVKMKAYGS